MKQIACIFGLILGIGLAGCASQGDIYNLDDRLVALEQRSVRTDKILKSEIQNYKSALSDKDHQGREQLATLYAGIDGLREDMQRLTGRVEEMEHLSRQQGQQVDTAFRTRENRLGTLEGDLTDLKNRLVRLEEYLNLEPLPNTAARTQPVERTPAAAPASPPPAPVELTESDLYERAKEAFDQGQHDDALKDFKAFVGKYPRSRNADNAQFWIGEIYYREQMYKQAMVEYDKVIENYPKGNKVQASMLKIGLAFYRLGDKANARLFLNDLIDKYPKSPEATIARQKIKSL
jgi:tol-pal system protein YbgF